VSSGEVLVGAVAAFDGGTRRVVVVGGVEVGVIFHEGEFFAFENRCAHQGGPVCEGVVVGRVESVLNEARAEVGRRFGSTMHLVCPWHSWEYDLRTGRAVADPRFGIRPYRVVCRGGDVYVSDELPDGVDGGGGRAVSQRGDEFVDSESEGRC
jgi:nitrite reductase/ring-hydroxylating ferredoxin subunit